MTDFIKAHFDVTIDSRQFVNTKGWGGLYREGLNTLRLISDQGGTNLVIFDTDKSETDIEESFVRRQDILLSKAKKHGVSISLFLFPNNQEDGDRETLLQKIANPSVYIPFSTCYEPYFDCLKQYGELYQRQTGLQLKIWPEKERRKLALINFLRIHGQKTDEDKRNYTDINFWNLQHEALIPLVEFLRPHFQ